MRSAFIFLFGGMGVLATVACGPKTVERGTRPTKKLQPAADKGRAPARSRTLATPAWDEGPSALSQQKTKTPRCPARGGVSLAPIIWDEAAGHLRRWIHETDVTNVMSSKHKPVEVCGVRGELRWLMDLHCKDGSHPFSDPRSAHAARVGNVGSGGRCGRVIDLYKVVCPAKTYMIYMDLYHCTAAEKGR
jgi:hypothetical protein